MRSLLSVLLPAVLLSGCASTTDVATRYTSDKTYAAIDTLLLVARTPEGNIRETWELTCKEIFSGNSLTILLSHQEIPLWYEGGKDRILDWAQKQGVDRILMVELTHLLIDAAQPPQPGNQLNPMDVNNNDIQPTWQVGIGGKLEKEEYRMHCGSTGELISGLASRSGPVSPPPTRPATPLPLPKASVRRCAKR